MTEPTRSVVAAADTLSGAGRWFPPERGPVLVIGNAGSIFPQHLAALWRSIGMDARIVTRRWDGARVLADGTPVMVTSDRETRAETDSYERIERLAWSLESRVARLQANRYRLAMGSETVYRPFVSPWLADAAGISRFVRGIKPQFICGQEVFAYGLATAFSRDVPRVLMPWGGDVYMYSRTTTFAHLAVRHALRHVDLVVPGSPLARDYLKRRFGVPLEQMHCGGLWVLDREECRRAASDGRRRICARHGVDPDALIVMNIRRFFPAWGCDQAFEAFLRFARKNSTAHFIMLGGAGTETLVARARGILVAEALADRFTLFEGDIPVDACRELMSVTDIAVSLMRELDMRPLASILEAAACGAALVLSDQPEYRAMRSLGFEARLCPPGDDAAVIAALEGYAAHRRLREEAASANREYLDRHEDGRRQAVDLLRRVKAVRDAYADRQRRV